MTENEEELFGRIEWRTELIQERGDRETEWLNMRSKSSTKTDRKPTTSSGGNGSGRSGSNGNGKRRRRDNGEEATLRLIELIRAGDQRAFGELMKRYTSHVSNIAYRMLGDVDDAKDVTQLVFVKTAGKLDDYDTSRRFSTWLYRITVNASVDYMRKRRRHSHELLDNYADSLENHDATPAQVYHRKHVRHQILKAAEQLNDRQRATFVLKDVEGHEVREIVEILDMPEATVRWYIHKARRKLRQELKGRLTLDFSNSQYISSFARN
jgi:RNA polymerase sigma-70 factor (ECF subfamily)